MKRMRLSGAAGVAAAVAFAGAARGQSAWLVEVEDLLSPGSPSTTVTVLARIDPGDFAFASGQFDLEVNVAGYIELSDLELLVGAAIGGSAGVAGPEGVRGIEAGQLHLPPAIFADPSSPIAVWRATATLIDPAAILCARTSTAEFRVFPSFSSSATLQRTPAEGSDLLRIPQLPPDYCYADCDGSQSLDLFDFLCFQNRFAARRSLADCNLDCFIDFFDFLCFQNAFAAGC